MIFKKHCLLLIFAFSPSRLLSNARPQLRPGVSPYSGALIRSVYMQKHPTFVPLFTSKVPKIESRRDTLSKTGRTARNLRPDSYGTLAHHRNQDLLSMLRLQDLHDKKGTDHNDFLCIKKKKRITMTFMH
jgi:hypothetical protein